MPTCSTTCTALEDLERVRLLFDDLETKRDVIDLLGRAEHADGARIFIGSENKVADREDAAPAGLQRPARRRRVRAGQHEALGVERDAGARQPVGVRLGADEQEQMADRPARLLARRAVPPADRLEHAVAGLRAR